MAWTYIKANGGMGIEAQYMLRWQNAPVACLKPAGPPADRWSLNLLLRSGISTKDMIVIGPLEQAKSAAERFARELGWSHVTTTGSEELRSDAAE